MLPESSISPEYLTSLVRISLGDPSAQAGEWGLEKLKGGLELGSAIYRLSGTAKAGGADQSWALIIKTIQPDRANDDPAGCHYWKRDPLAYQSGLLYTLPARITAPRCIDVRENPDGSVWICMEEVKDEQARPWSLELYAQVARQLGEFNGAYLAGRALPSEAWITHDWLRKYLQEAAPMIEFIRQNPAHPIVNAMLPGITLPLTLAVWEEHHRMLTKLGSMPQTFCHQDAFERNMFYRGGELVLIDWNYAGIAPIGTELVALVGVAFGLANFPVSQARELDQACFENYLEGLRASGWQPDQRQVRLCYCLTVTLRYVIGATIGEVLPGLLNQATREHWAEGMNKGEEYAGESDPGIVAYYTAIYMEGLKSLGLAFLLRVVARTISHAIRLSGKRRVKVTSKSDQSS
jgi:hypothetical protein